MMSQPAFAGRHGGTVSALPSLSLIQGPAPAVLRVLRALLLTRLLATCISGGQHP